MKYFVLTAVAYVLAFAHDLSYLARASTSMEESLRFEIRRPTQMPDEIAPFVTSECVSNFIPGALVAMRANDKPQEVFKYRLFKPKKDANGPIPLIVWLHGWGENGHRFENTAQLRYLENLFFEKREDSHTADFYLLAPQCPKDNPAWFRGGTNSLIAPGDATIYLIEMLCDSVSIDRDRIYLTGVCAGAAAAWEMAIRNPDLFAALVPLAGSGGSHLGLTKLKHLPIWAFHNSNDSIVPPRSVAGSIRTLKELRGNCHLTLTTESPDGATIHDCWSTAFKTYRILDWMLLQKKGHDGSPRAGAIPANVIMKMILTRATSTAVLANVSFWGAVIVLTIVAASSCKRESQPHDPDSEEAGEDEKN